MKTVTFAAIIIAFCAATATAEKPKTVDEAVQVLKTKWLKPKDLDWILRAILKMKSCGLYTAHSAPESATSSDCGVTMWPCISPAATTTRKVAPL
jgi:hypothetical protein